MIEKLKRPMTMIILPESDHEKEATRKRQRRTHTDSSTLVQAALILALSAELHHSTRNSTVKPSQSSSHYDESSSCPRSFGAASQVYHTTTMTDSSTKNSSPRPNVLTSQLQVMNQCFTHHVRNHMLQAANPSIRPSTIASTRMTTIRRPSLPSGKPLLAPPRLPHLKLGEHLSRQKCG